MLWERVLIALDPVVRGFDIGGLEWRFAYDEGVNNNSERPDVDLVGVAGASFKDLGRDVVGCSTNGSLFLAFKIELGCQAEITQLKHHLVIQKQVAQLEIAMDNPVMMQVLESIDDLAGVALDLEFVETLTPLQQLVHTLVAAKLQKNVDALAILEKVHELCHICMFH